MAIYFSLRRLMRQQIIEPLVIPAGGDEVAVTALLDNFTMAHDEDAVDVADGG